MQFDLSKYPSVLCNLLRCFAFVRSSCLALGVIVIAVDYIQDHYDE